MLIESKNLVCDESSLTGEADAVAKEVLTTDNEQFNPCPFVMQSSIANTGEGRALVCVVGERTRVGRS